MARNLKYLQKYKDTIQKLCNKYDITPKEAEDMLDHFFRTFKEMVTDERMPKIQITNLGTFKPTIGKINFQIRRSFYFYHKGKITRENLCNRIATLWPIKQRLIKEMNGEITWKEWRNKKS